MKTLLRAGALLCALALQTCALEPAAAQYSPFTSAPPPIGAITGGEVFTIIQNGKPYTITLGQLQTWVKTGVSAPTLNALSISSTSATAGTALSATLSGNTSGSTLSAGACSDGTQPTISGLTFAATFGSAGTPTCPVTETLASAVGSPRTTTFSFAVASAPTTTPTPAPAVASLDLSQGLTTAAIPVLF